MEKAKIKTSKKALRELINTSVNEAISKLALPKPSKKIKKIVTKSAKRLASVYADTIKREVKKKIKVEKAIVSAENILKGKKRKRDKVNPN